MDLLMGLKSKVGQRDVMQAPEVSAACLGSDTSLTAHISFTSISRSTQWLVLGYSLKP